MKKYLLFSLLVFSFFDSFSQDFSNKGKDFYLCFPSHVPSAGVAQMYIFITSDKNSSGIITYNGQSQSFNVTQNTVTTVPINRTPAYILDAESNTPVPKGIRVKVNAGQPAVVVYTEIYASARTEASLILPVNVLGRKYRAISYYQRSTANSKSQFQIISVEPNTTVQIQLMKNGFLSGAPFTINLPNAGDVYQIQDDLDLSGSYIESVATSSSPCKKIAVFSGSSAIAINSGTCSGGSYDPLFQQCYPITSWGKNFGVVPIAGNPAGFQCRVMASEDNTSVTYNGTNVTLNAGQVYPAIAQNVVPQTQPFFITSNKPVSVSQYLLSQNCAGAGAVGDPDMIILNPIEQNISNITIFTSTKQNISQQRMNVLIPSAGINSFKINGNLVSGFQSMPTNPAFAYLNYLFPYGDNSYTLSSDSGFNAICYGLGDVETYGYSAGTNVKDLYQFVGIVNPNGITNEPAACAGTPFYFSITLPYQPLSLVWDFNGYQTPNVTQNNPAYDSTYVIAGKQVWRYKLNTAYNYPIGTFPVSVTTNNPTSEGCSGEQVIDFELNVYAPPVANFTYLNNGCSTDSVRFSDSSQNNGRPIYKWYWDFGDGTFSNAASPAHLYAAAGTYNVRYSITTNVGCLSDTITKQVSVSSAPVAKFAAVAPYCIGKSITFADSSSTVAPSTISKWFWDYGDGFTEVVTTGGNRTHTYISAGTFTVTLKVETSSGCQSSLFSQQVVVHVNPVANFSLPTVCLPTPAQFNDLSTISDGTQNLFTYLWTFGEPSSGSADSSIVKNPLHTYSSGGPFTVILRVTSNNGCRTDTTKLLNTIYSQATSGFNANASNCLNDSTAFTSTSTLQAGSTISNYYWEFGDGGISSLVNPKHLYLAAGTYTVKHYVKTDKGCNSDTATKQVVIHPLPTANFNFSAPRCASRAITFTDVSTAGAGAINAWKWNMGDGNSFTNTNGNAFTYSYANTGTYTVTLSVETNNGCKSTVVSKQVIITATPKPGFIMPEVCLTDAFAQFTDTSTISDGTQAQFTYLWNFGDPASGPLNTSNQKNPQHTYTAVGVYTVTLTVTSNQGCDSTISKQFTVNGSVPVADYTVQNPTTICSYDSVRINNTSTVNFGTITKVEIYWDFVNNPTQFDTDDTPAPNKAYSHLYPVFNTPASVTYRVRLRAFSGGTCVDEEIKDVVVNAKPGITFAPIPNSCSNAAFQITQASVAGNIPGNGVYTGPGVTSTGFFDANIAGVGVHTIRYTFTTPAGCTDFKEQTISVVGVATSSFTVSSPKCVSQAITFVDASSTPSGSINTRRWNFGDGTPDTVVNNGNPITHTFTTVNTFQVKLTVTTSNGCSKDTIIPVTVTPLPVPDFSFNEACLPNASVQFTDLSTISDNTQSTFTYSWNFGDPVSGAANTSSAKNPVHVYNSTGPFIVTLTVTSGSGCSRTTSKVYDKIHPRPVANFTHNPDEVCIGDAITFTDASNGGDSTLIEWRWNFGDGTTFTGKTPPAHIFASAGAYNVSLYVVNARLCASDTFRKVITINPYPTVDIGPDQNVLEGGSIVLNPNVTGTSLSYLWTPNNYINDVTIKNPTVSGVADITYTLVVTARGGCSDTDQVRITVLKFPTIPNTFTPNNDGINDTWVITALHTYPDARVQVFSRYGQLVYESKGYPKPWDGNMKGKPLPFGTYYYVIEPGSGRKPITGYVTLVK